MTLKVPNQHPLHCDDIGYDVHELCPWLEADVRSICEAFDQRNGKDWHAQVTKQWLELLAAG